MFSFLLLWPPSELLSTWLMQVSQETYMAAWLETFCFRVEIMEKQHQHSSMDVWMYHVP